MPAACPGAARSADLERQAGGEVVEVGRALEFGAVVDGVLAEAGLGAAHDGIRCVTASALRSPTAIAHVHEYGCLRKTGVIQHPDALPRCAGAHVRIRDALQVGSAPGKGGRYAVLQ